VEARAAKFGTSHAAYAHALEALADALRAAEKHFEALPLANKAILIMWNNGDARLPAAIATRATSAMFLGAQPLQHAKGLPEETFARTVAAILARADRDAPLLHARVLAELLALVQKRSAPHGDMAVEVMAALSCAARKARAHIIRVDALNALVAAHDAREEPARALEAVLGLALADDEAERVEDALDAYNEAVRRAEKLRSAPAMSNVARNFGLFLVHTRPFEARAWLERAIDEAKRAGEAVPLARAQLALGIQLQHAGTVLAARPLLLRAIGGLPKTHPEHALARAHLDALDAGAPCACAAPASHAA
jgi:tetratricopeptide (TPR) repeat protein